MAELSANDGLPHAISRPLWRGATAILCFLVVFCIWSVIAPLATTLQLSGKLISARPTYELQHPHGGSIAEVYVNRHDTIEAGQPILRMDVSLEKTQLKTLQTTISDYEQENRIISAILNQETGQLEGTSLSVGWSYVESSRQADLQIEQQRTKAKNLTQQRHSLAKKINIAEQHLHIMLGRQNRVLDLAENGLVSVSDREVLSEQILILRSEIEGDRASLIATQGQAETAQTQAELIGFSMRERLLKTRDANAKHLQEKTQKYAALKQKVDQSVVRSPVQGTVSNVFFLAKGAYAARGATLASLTQPLEQPFVSFEIPVGQIDQVMPGMKGRLVLTSLPQRSMPKIDVSIAAISPRANLNENGIPISYTGRAELKSDALDQIMDAMTNATLVEDMPVQLLVEARETTLAGYIFRPFMDGLRSAVQD